MSRGSICRHTPGRTEIPHMRSTHGARIESSPPGDWPRFWGSMTSLHWCEIANTSMVHKNPSPLQLIHSIKSRDINSRDRDRDRVDRLGCGEAFASMFLQ